jgi:AP-2 complex subunit alpha
MLTFELQMYRLTIRATDESVPQILMEAMEKRLALGEAPFYPP